MTRTLHRPAVLATLTAAALAATLATPVAAQAAAAAEIAGVVVSPTGTPVANVGVGGGGEDSGIFQRTDSYGRFDFTGLAAGDEYTLCARLSQDAPEGGAAGFASACVDVTVGDTDVRLQFTPGAAVSGVVTDLRSGRPLGGATVLVPDTNDVALGFPNGYPAPVVTDSRGRWGYRNLRPARNYPIPATASLTTTAAPYGYTPAAGGAAVVTLRAGQVTPGLAIQVVPVARYSGTVVSTAGRPVRGVTVAVQTTPGFGRTVTGADGTWTLNRPWSGSADVCTFAGASAAHPTGLAPVCRVVEARGTTVTRRLTLSNPDGGAVTGAVPTPAGTPPGAVTVGVDVPVPGAGAANGAEDSLLTVPGSRNADGTYTVAGLPTGRYRVTASAAISTGASAVGYSKPVTVTRGATATFSTISLSTGGA